MMSLQLIDRTDMAEIWPVAQPYIGRAMQGSPSDYTMHDIFGSIVDGEYQLWLGRVEGELKYVGITKYEHFGEKRSLLVMWLAGDDMNEWAHMAVSELEIWAKLKGIDELRITGREGWERVFKGDGFRKTHTVLAKPLRLDP
jgi:hypothetical protein